MVWGGQAYEKGLAENVSQVVVAAAKAGGA